MTFPQKIAITEEGPREGFQIEKGDIPTDRKVELINALSETGVKRIVTVAFVNPKRVPGMRDADEVVELYTRTPGVAYSAITLNEKGLQRGIDSGRLDLTGDLILVASDEFLRRNQGVSFEESLAIQRNMAALYAQNGIPVERGVIAASFGCNFQGDVPFERVLELIALQEDIAADTGGKLTGVTLADTMAWATPYAIKQKVGLVRDRFPYLEITLHLHDTRGLGMANAYAGLEAGVTSFDAAVGGLGGCPFAGHSGAAGNICTEELVFLCDELGIETGIDLEKLIACATLAEDIVGHPLPGAMSRARSLASLREKIALRQPV